MRMPMGVLHALQSDSANRGALQLSLSFEGPLSVDWRALFELGLPQLTLCCRVTSRILDSVMLDRREDYGHEAMRSLADFRRIDVIADIPLYCVAVCNLRQILSVLPEA